MYISVTKLKILNFRIIRLNLEKNEYVLRKLLFYLDGAEMCHDIPASPPYFQWRGFRTLCGHRYTGN